MKWNGDPLFRTLAQIDIEQMFGDNEYVGDRFSVFVIPDKI